MKLLKTILADRDGSFNVMAVLCFSAILIAVGAAILSSGNVAIDSAVNSFGRLWGTSLLAEYDLNLKDRYGIFAFYGNEAMIKNKLEGYADFSFADKSYIDYEIDGCKLDTYCLINSDVFEKQLHEAIIFGTNPKVIERGEGSQTAGSNYGNRTITSPWVLKGLPSAGALGDLSINSIAAEIKDRTDLADLIGNSLTNTYIIRFFKSHLDEKNLGESFFKNEMEYILSGNPSDDRSLKNVQTKLKTLRNILNLAYLYSCPEKREAAMAMATVLTAGGEAVVTQAVILETWAYAEAVNDVNRLMDGKKVSLLKNDSNWALSLENAMGAERIFERGYIEVSDEEGCTYEEYLRILLNFLPKKIKLLRVMDLIQINMKFMYCDYFLIEDYYVGVEFKMNVNEGEYEFKETYKRE